MNSTASCQYYIIFSRLYSSAESLCTTLSHHPNVACHGEAFAASTRSRSRWKAMGFTLEQQRAEPGHFLRTMADRCDRSTCGVLVMPNQVPEKHLTMLFAANCSVRVLVVERRNVTAEYDEFRRHSAHRHDDVKVSAEHYAKMHKEWFHTVGRVSERAKAHTHRLATEQLNEALWTSSPLDALSHPILTAVLANLLQRRTSALQPQAVQSAVAAKAGDMHEHTSSYRERRRRNIVYSASAAFLVTCVAGLCLALGIALGERHARKLQLLHGEQAPQDERAAQSSLATPAQPVTSPDKPSNSPKRDRTGHAGTPHYTRVDSGDTPPNGGGGGSLLTAAEGLGAVVGAAASLWTAARFTPRSHHLWRPIAISCRPLRRPTRWSVRRSGRTSRWSTRAAATRMSSTALLTSRRCSWNCTRIGAPTTAPLAAWVQVRQWDQVRQRIQVRGRSDSEVLVLLPPPLPPPPSAPPRVVMRRGSFP
jgi:hypothetical protein